MNGRSFRYIAMRDPSGPVWKSEKIRSSGNGGMERRWTCIHRWSEIHDVLSIINTHPSTLGGNRSSKRQKTSYRCRACVHAALGGASVHQDGEMVLSHMASGRLTSGDSHNGMWMLGAHTFATDRMTYSTCIVLQHQLTFIPYLACTYIEICRLPLRASGERPRP